MSPTSDHILLGAFIHGDEISGQKETQRKTKDETRRKRYRIAEPKSGQLFWTHLLNNYEIVPISVYAGDGVPPSPVWGHRGIRGVWRLDI